MDLHIFEITVCLNVWTFLFTLPKLSTGTVKWGYAGIEFNDKNMYLSQQ